LIIVSGEEDLLVCGHTPTPYIEAAGEALETSFQALEIVSTTYIEPFRVNPHLSKASLMVAKTMMEKGYKYGSGLGKNNDGSMKPLELIENKGRYGLGYKPTQADRRKRIEETIERRQARIEGREPKTKGIPLCSLYQSFYSVRWINLDQVAAIEWEPEDEGSNFVHPCLPDEQIGNWKTVEILVVYTHEEM